MPGLAFGDPPTALRRADERARTFYLNRVDQQNLSQFFCREARLVTDEAIAQGDAEALVIAGERRRDGVCIMSDFADALRLFRLAEERQPGSARAQLALASARGQGVPQSFAEAGRRMGVVKSEGASERQATMAGYMASLRLVVERGIERAVPPTFPDESAIGRVRFVWRIDSAARSWTLTDTVGLDDTALRDLQKRDARIAVDWLADILGEAAESLPAWPADAGTAPIYEIPFTIHPTRNAN